MERCGRNTPHSAHGDRAVFENGLHRVFVEPSAQGWYPWQDEAVRNALSLAIDREGIARSLRRGTVVPTGILYRLPCGALCFRPSYPMSNAPGR